MSFSKRIVEGFDQFYSDIKSKLDLIFSKIGHNHSDLYLTREQVLELVRDNAKFTVPDMTRSVRVGVNEFRQGEHSIVYSDYNNSSTQPLFSNPPNGVPYVLEILRPCFVRIGITSPASRNADGDWGVIIADTKERACYYRHTNHNWPYDLMQLNTALDGLGKPAMINDKNISLINVAIDGGYLDNSGNMWVPLTPGTWVRPGVFGFSSTGDEYWEYWTASIAPFYGEEPNTVVAKRHLFAVKSRYNGFINSGLDFGTVSGTNSEIRIYKKDAYDSTTPYVDISQPLDVIC